MWQRFSIEGRTIVFHAQRIAEELGDGNVSNVHMLIALCWEPGTAAGAVLRSLGTSQQAVQTASEFALPPQPQKSSGPMTLSPDAKEMVKRAYDEARKLKSRYVGTEHLLLGCLSVIQDSAPDFLTNLGFSLNQARVAVADLAAAEQR